MHLFIRKRLFKLVWVFCIIATLFYVEFIEYNYPNWYNYKCKHKDCTKILLVADPHILGLHTGTAHFITPLAIWDCDRYLTKTYQIALEHAKPDIVIFLGDLFDEGSTATEAEHKSYLRRFKKIFNYKYIYEENNIMYMFVPGKTDLGEHFEKNTEKLKTFQENFGSENIIVTHRNLSFLKVDNWKRTIPDSKLLAKIPSSQLRIIINHIPVLTNLALFRLKILNELRPQLVFSGQTHKWMMITYDPNISPLPGTNNNVFEINLNINETHEVIAPTCSYRMGTTKIGFGYAVIEENKKLWFTVLWSPSRYHQFLLYFLVCVLGLYIWYFHYHNLR